MSISAHDKEIQALVNEVNEGKLLLPEMQRQYVWKSTQVREYFDSLYRQYPSGQLLVWATDDLPYTRPVAVDEVQTNSHRPQLLLDGQQRLTSLTAVICGRDLMVRDSKRPLDIVFNVYTEKFEVAKPTHRQEAGWISLSKLFTQGELTIARDLQLDLSAPDVDLVFDRLRRVSAIKQYKYRVNVLDGLNYTTVTDIFVRINSGGTKLGSADLTLAQLSSRWRGITAEFTNYLEQLERLGLIADNSLLTRTLCVFATGQSKVSLLFRGERQNMPLEDLQRAWARVKRAMLKAVHFLMNNCKIDRLELLPTQNILIPLSVFFDVFTDIQPEQVQDLTKWVFLALIWTRYSGAVETALDQDVGALIRQRSVLQMIQNIEKQVGKRTVTEVELRDQRKNSPFLLVSYVLARRAHASDWFNGVEIGRNQNLELHHIFPKKYLSAKYDLRENSLIIDQIANLAFLTEPANKRIAAKAPADYLPSIPDERLRAQLIPMESDLWTIERFEDFLLRRRQLLAERTNMFLQQLGSEPRFWTPLEVELLEERVDAVEGEMRKLVAELLEDLCGAQAWQECISSQIRRTVDQRINTHVLQQPFDAERFATLAERLTLCQFSDYARIVRDNWQRFEEAFGREDVFANHFNNLVTARNAIAHNRPLNAVQLASAEAGLLWLESAISMALSRLHMEAEEAEFVE